MSRFAPFTIPLPVRGLNEAMGHEGQPPNTTPRAQNVVSFSPGTDRLQLALRPGLSRYIDNDFGDDIVAGHALIRTNERVTYSLRSVPVQPWSKASPNAGARLTVDVDLQNNVYVSDGFSGITKYTSSGEKLWTYSLDGVNEYQIIKRLKLDGAGNLFVCANDIRVTPVGPGYVKRFEIREDGLREVWTITEPDITGDIFDLDVVGGTIVFLEQLASARYCLYRYDGALGRRPYKVWKYASGTDVGYVAAVKIASDGHIWVSMPNLTAGTGSPFTATLPGGMMKHSPLGGEAMWDAPVSESWLGWGFYERDGECWSWGLDSANSYVRVAKWDVPAGQFDATASLPSPPTISVDAGWNSGAQYTPPDGGGFYTSEFFGAQTMDVDRNGAVYIAIETDASAGDGLLMRLPATGDDIDWTTGSYSGYAVKLDNRLVGAAAENEFLFFASGNLLYKERQYDTTITDSPSRETMILLAEGGSLHVWNLTTGADATPATGDDITTIDDNDRYTHIFDGFNVAFVLDGEGYLKYDPVGGASNTGSIREWEASKGEMPRRCKLGEVASGRAFLARSDTAPQVWYCSARGDFDNWDFFPIDPVATQAVAGNLSEAGECPDIINALIPASEDALIFGCETSIWVLVGDPGPGQGGRMVRVSDEIGIAFGKAWCKDDVGMIYFLSTRGGIYAMAPGGRPERISNAAIERRLQDIEQDEVRVSLGWDYRQQALLVYITEYTQAGALPQHLLWSKRLNAWWPIVFDDTNHNPLAVTEVDDDQSDNRHLVMFGRDGYVRYFDRAAKDDDGTAIEAFVFTQPLQPAGDQHEAFFTAFKAVLGSDSDSVTWAAYGLEVAELPASPTTRVTGSWTAGRNGASWERVRGSTVAMRFSSDATDVYWSIEEVTAQIQRAGESRAL